LKNSVIQGWENIFSTEGHIEDFIATEGRMFVLHIFRGVVGWERRSHTSFWRGNAFPHFLH